MSYEGRLENSDDYEEKAEGLSVSGLQEAPCEHKVLHSAGRGQSVCGLLC